MPPKPLLVLDVVYSTQIYFNTLFKYEQFHNRHVGEGKSDGGHDRRGGVKTQSAQGSNDDHTTNQVTNSLKPGLTGQEVSVMPQCCFRLR